MTEEMTTYLEQIVQHPYFSIAIAATIVLLIALRWIAKKTQSIAVSANASGRVRISRHALYELVQRACEQLGASTKPAIKFSTTQNKLNFEIRIRMNAAHKLDDISSRIQHMLTKTLREDLGMDNLGRMDILITGIDGAPEYTPLDLAHTAEETPEMAACHLSDENAEEQTEEKYKTD